GGGRPRGRREGHGARAALERGQARLERGAIGRAAARVDVAVWERAVGLALERRGWMDGRRHGAGGGIHLGARVHGDGLDPHGALLAGMVTRLTPPAPSMPASAGSRREAGPRRRAAPRARWRRSAPTWPPPGRCRPRRP